jgi:Xaa-Pro dipeptidase
MIVNKPENIYYLTGFQTLGYFAFQALIVDTERDPVFIIRYGERSNVVGRSWIRDYEFYRDTEDPTVVTAAVIASRNVDSLGVETDSWFISPGQYEKLTAQTPNVRREACPDLVDQCRVVKSNEELAYMRAAAKISSLAIKAGMEAAETAVSDADIVAAVLGSTVRAGGEYAALPPLICVGADTALFHNTWTGRKIAAGDVLFMEVPGVVKRYLAPIARTVVFGRPPDYVTERYKVICESLDRGLDAIRPGISFGEVYEAFAAPVLKAGYEVPINTGYAVGINFPPRWSEAASVRFLPGNKNALEPGMTFHTPRTIRKPGEQTPIVSETVLVTETGCDILTDAPRDLRQIVAAHPNRLDRS